MSQQPSRRGFLKGGVAAGAAAVALTPLASKPAFAASLGDWTANNASITSFDGSVSDIYVPAGAATYTIEWSGLDPSQTVTLTIEARLADSGTYETLSTGEFTLGSESGSVDESTISWDVEPFPFSFINDHSTISASDFENPDGGTTKETAVDTRFTFDYGDDTVTYTDQFVVAVSNTSSEIIDNFDDGDTSEYSVFDDTGGTFAVDTSRAYNGSYSQHYSESDSSSRVRAQSQSGLNYYPSRGDVFEYYIYLGTENVLHTFWWAFDTLGTYSPNNGYGLDINDGDNNQLNLLDMSAGSAIDSASVDWPTGVWLRVEVDFQDTITVTVERTDTGDQLAQVSGTDTHRDTGGIGIGWNGDADIGGSVEAHLDAIRKL